MVSAKKQAFLDRKKSLKAIDAEVSDVAVKPQILTSDKAKKWAHVEQTAPEAAGKLERPAKKRKVFAKEAPEANNKNATLYVRNLSFKTTQEQLEAFFSAVSPVKHTVIITNPETSVSLGT